MPCRQNLLMWEVFWGGREGGERVRETERDEEKKRKRKKREVGRVSPIKGTACLACSHDTGVTTLQGPQGAGPDVPGC